MQRVSIKEAPLFVRLLPDDKLKAKIAATCYPAIRPEDIHQAVVSNKYLYQDTLDTTQLSLALYDKQDRKIRSIPVNFVRGDGGEFIIAEMPSGSEQKRMFDEMMRSQDATQYLCSPRATSGSDPEFFVVDKKTGELIPAFKFLRHKKNSPSLFYDGYQAEITASAAGCLQTFGGYLRQSLYNLNVAAEKAGGRITIKSVMPISDEQLRDAKDDEVALGCDPSLNAYDMKGIEVADPRTLNVRFAGGHRHAGLSSLRDRGVAPRVVKALDKTIGLADVALAEGMDNPIRRMYYGLAGEYRLPPHGLEYRTSSNYWMSHPAIYHLSFEIFRMGMGLGLWKLDEEALPYKEQDVIAAINTSNVELARELIRSQEKFWRFMLERRFGYSGKKCVDLAWATLMEGARAIVKDVDNVAVNWGVDAQTWSTGDWRTAQQWSAVVNYFNSSALSPRL